jgi:RNA recognition motif-containing protein
MFERFGLIVYTRIPFGKGCGFVQFKERLSAENSIEEMNGFLVGILY